MTSAFYQQRAVALRAGRAEPLHRAAIQAHAKHHKHRVNGARRFETDMRDWGTSSNQPNLGWREVDASARKHGVAITYLAAFDAVSLSNGPGMHAYAGTPAQALQAIRAMVNAKREGQCR